MMDHPYEYEVSRVTMKLGVSSLKVPDGELIGPRHGPLRKVDVGVFRGSNCRLTRTSIWR